MIDVFAKIEELIQQVGQLQPLAPEIQAKLDKKFRLEFNYNSNHIEGNTLTYGETMLFLLREKTSGEHDSREYEEMKAHDLALSLVKEWALDQERPLTESNIKELNRIILVKPFWKEAITPSGDSTRRQIKVGDYKEFPNSVRLSNGELFEYASVTDTPILMGELMQWYREEEAKQELPPVALAALLHYKFVRIHPFDDGNGRLSRLLMNYVLWKNNLPPIIIKSSDKRNYLSALQRADAGDLNYFINYIAEQLLWSLELTMMAANGEEIEELNDIDKEIILWKKEVVQRKSKIISQSPEVILELYTKNIEYLFQQFEAKHKVFYDLFEKVKVSYRTEIGHQFYDVAIGQLSNIQNIQSELFKSTVCIINLGGYQYVKLDTFDVVSLITCQFHESKYEIRYHNQKLEKPYAEFLTKEEMDIIVSVCVKAIHTEIKEKSGV